MATQIRKRPIERSKPNIRDDIDGVKFRELMPGITTHPMIRGGRPCIEGTGIKVTDIAAQQKFHGLNAAQIANHYAIELHMVEAALNYYAAHKDYIDTDIELGNLNHHQFAEAQYGTKPNSILSRRRPVASHT